MPQAAKDLRITSAEMLFQDATTHCTMSALGGARGFPAGVTDLSSRANQLS